jgi:sulfatase maturation enzyme AslB (radical SAM superfamily)
LEYIIIGFIGGEPMLHKSKLIKIIEKINDMVKKLKKKVYYHIDTNGTIDFSDIFNNFKHIELSITLSNKIDHNKNRPSSNFDSYESIFSNLRKCYNKANKLSIRYNTNHENINDFEHFVKKIKKELPIVYNIDAMYTDNYEYNSDFDNKLNISEFTKWNSSKAIDILIKYNYPITGSISSKLQLCSAYQPFSCKIHSDGFVTLCDSMEYSNQLNIKDLSLDINMLDIVFNKYKKYNPTMDIHCKECSQIVQCQGQLLCRTDKCKYQKRYDEKLFIAKFVEYSLKDKADFFTGM